MYIPSFNEQLRWYNEKKIIYPLIQSNTNKPNFETPIQNRASFLLGVFENSQRLNNERIEENQSKCLDLLKNAGQLVDSAFVNNSNSKKVVYVCSEKNDSDDSSYYNSSESDTSYYYIYHSDYVSSSDEESKTEGYYVYNANGTYTGNASNIDSDSSDEFHECISV